MSKKVVDSRESLRRLAGGDLASLDTLQSFIEATLKDSGLDPQTYMLVRVAALVAMDAAPASWLMNIEASGEAGLAPETILGTLIALAPVVGTARIVSAAANIMQAFELEEEVAQGG